MKVDGSIFKAYDIRGIYPEQLNEDLAYLIGQGYAKVIKPDGKVAVGMDVRLSSPQLKKALIEGLVDAGIDVVDVGLISTEMIYFAVGYYGYAGGIQVTASHNPAEYNGFKMVRREAAPISSETGIFEIRDYVSNTGKFKAKKRGSIETKEILQEFATFVLKYIDPAKIKPLKLVYNPNFGFEGEVLKAVIKAGNLPLEIVGLNDTPDGNFPKGRPDPFVPENRPEFVQLVKDEKADLGVAWDADADRVFFATNSGKFVEPYFLNSALLSYMLKKNPGETVVYDPRYTWATIDAVMSNGGKVVPERVGHSFIKACMRKENAIFCGEASGHTYLRDFYYADSGIIPLLLVLEMICVENKNLDQILEPLFAKYFISGEHNTTVTDPKVVIGQIKDKYKDAELSTLDGLSIEYSNWRANIRTSNTEPLLRLNVEAKSEPIVQEKLKELLGIIRGNQMKQLPAVIPG